MAGPERRALAARVRQVAAGVRGLAALEAAGAGPRTAGSVARRAERRAAAAAGAGRERGGGAAPRVAQFVLRRMFAGETAVPGGYEVARRSVYRLRRAA
jgi:hypothetical protein